MIKSHFYPNGWVIPSSPTACNALKEISTEQLIKYVDKYPAIFDIDLINLDSVMDALHVNFPRKALSNIQRFTYACLIYCELSQKRLQKNRPHEFVPTLAGTTTQVGIGFSTSIISPELFIDKDDVKAFNSKQEDASTQINLPPGNNYSILDIFHNGYGGYSILVKSLGTIVEIEDANYLIDNKFIKLCHNEFQLKIISQINHRFGPAKLTIVEAYQYVEWAKEIGLYIPTVDVVKLKMQVDFKSVEENAPKFSKEDSLGSKSEEEIEAYVKLIDTPEVKDTRLDDRIKAIQNQLEIAELLHESSICMVKMNPVLKVSLNLVKDDLEKRIKEIKELKLFLEDGTFPSHIKFEKE